MLRKRVIACLDIKDGRTVKGINFENIRDAGDPVQLAGLYAEQGIDELVFLDITATHEKRKTLAALASAVAAAINIPFTVGGGITSVEDVRILLENGADKISINSAAVRDPALIERLAYEFGSQCIVLAIDSKSENGKDRVYLNGGRLKTDLETLSWARQAVDSGAGEILLTSMDHDGTKNGFALDLTARLSAALPVPIIASGGGGSAEHFKNVFAEGRADAALAASIFHYGEVSIPFLKNYLADNHIPVRI